MDLACAHRLAAAGMSLTIAEIEAPALGLAVVELPAAGTEAIGVHTNTIAEPH